MKKIYNIIILVTKKVCHLWTRNCFEKKSREENYDITNWVHWARDIPSVSFNSIPYQIIVKMEETDFLLVEFCQLIVSEAATLFQSKFVTRS